MDVHVFCLNFSASPTDPTVLKKVPDGITRTSLHRRNRVYVVTKRCSRPGQSLLCAGFSSQTSKTAGTSSSTATAFWFVEKNRDHFTEDDKVVLMLDYYDVSPKFPYEWLKFSVEFNVKAHFFNPSDKNLCASIHKHSITDVLEKTDPFINKTLIGAVQSLIETSLNESGKAADECKGCSFQFFIVKEHTAAYRKLSQIE